jgi:predicted metal-binding membrane protein
MFKLQILWFKIFKFIRLHVYLSLAILWKQIIYNAIVAAYVTVFKAFKLVDTRFLPLVSLVIAAAFILSPEYIYSKLVLISTIGLGSDGVYHMTKNKGMASND